MADDIEQRIKLTYETNAEEASKKVNNLTGSLDKTDTAQGKVTKSTKETGKAHQEAAKGAKGQADALESMGGSMGSAISGMKGMLKQMWLLVANPIVLTIVAIVGGLALLFKAFTSTKAGGEQLDRVMAGISAVIDVLRDRVLKVGSALVKFFSGDFKGAIEDGKAAVSGFGEEVEKEFRQAANAAKMLQEVADATRNLGVQRAKLNRDLAEAKEIITDENASYAEKKKAIEAVKKSEGEQTEQELTNAKKKLAAIKLANSLSDTGKEDLQKEADAEAALYNLQQESANNRRAINKADKRADNEESSRLKALAAERNAKAKEHADKLREIAKLKKDLLNEGLSEEQKALRKNQDLNDKTDEEKLARQKERDLADIELLKKKGIDVRNLLTLNNELYNTLEDELKAKRAEEASAKQKVIDDKKLEAKQKTAAEEKIIADAMVQQERDVLQAKLNIAQQGIQLIAGIFGKSKAIQKAAIIAENAIGIGKMIIANNLANIGALATPQAIASSGASAVPVIAMNNISTGIGVASTIAATAKALQAVGGGGSASGGSQQSGGRGATTGASATPQVNFQASRENQIGNTLAGKLNEQAPIRVTVLENDITKVQNNVIAKVVSNSF